MQAMDSVVTEARNWARRRELGLPADPPEEMPIEVQAVAFELISETMLEQEARQYLLRRQAHLEALAVPQERVVWPRGSHCPSLDRLCSRLRAAVLQIEAVRNQTPTTLAPAQSAHVAADVKWQALQWMRDREDKAKRYIEDLKEGIEFNVTPDDPEELTEPLRSEVFRLLSSRTSQPKR